MTTLPSTAELILKADWERPRSQQKGLGMSDLGGCRRRAGYQLHGLPPEKPSGSVPAVIGTAVHDTADVALRMMRDAGIIPAVLGGDSMPLDVGRKKRHHSEYQRVAIVIRDKTCRAEGCDRTGSLHVHHRKRWADGGETSVDEGVALCAWHHSRIHDTTFEAQLLPDGRVSFHRRE